MTKHYPPPSTAQPIIRRADAKRALRAIKAIAEHAPAQDLEAARINMKIVQQIAERALGGEG